MLKFLFSISVLTLVVSCSTEEKPAKPKEDKPEVAIESNNNKVYDPSSVVSRSEQFFDWYAENSRMLYKMRSSCIGAENGYHALDKKKLEEYTQWLKETGFFSDNFIASEHKRWTTECASIMREIARKKQRLVGPPPCLFEGDIFFKMQERPSAEAIAELEYNVSEQTDSTAIVLFAEKGKLNWIRSNDSWQIDTWPN